MYPIQNRHQDSGWEPSGRSGTTFEDACALAREMSREQMIWGMTRVLHPDGYCHTFTCGRDLAESLPDPATGRHREPITPARAVELLTRPWPRSRVRIVE